MVQPAPSTFAPPAILDTPSRFTERTLPGLVIVPGNAWQNIILAQGLIRPYTPLTNAPHAPFQWTVVRKKNANFHKKNSGMQVNVQGEIVKRLDILSNETLIHALRFALNSKP